MKKLGIALLMMTGCTGVVDAAEIWSVIEGENGNLRGTWTLEREDGALKGSALMYDRDGEKVTYFLSGRIDDGSYVIERMGPSDDQACLYEGDVKSSDEGASKKGVIAGSVRCGYKTGPWEAQRTKD